MLKRFGLIAVLVGVLAIGAGVSPVSSQTSSVEFPLAEWLGFGHDAAADDAYFAQQEVQFENLVDECMHSEGFEYFPDSSIEVGEDEVTTADQMWALMQSDPNTSYRASLSNDTRRLYDLALAGVPNANWQGAPVGGGCLGIADKRVPSVYTAYNALRLQYDDLQFTIASDPRVLDAVARWSECMQGLGFSYPTIDAMHASIGIAVQEGQSTEEVNQVTTTYQQAVEASPQCLFAVSYHSSWDAAQMEHEAVFVDTHREILDALGVQS